MMRSPVPTLLSISLALVLGDRARSAGGDDPSPSRSNDPFEIETAFGYESLSNNFSDWKTFSLELLKKFEARTAVYGGFRQTERFSLVDRQILAGVYYPLDTDLSLFSEIGVSPTHHVLPQWSVVLELQKGIGAGWILHGAYRHIHYEASPTDLAFLTGEYYWNAFRASYTLYASKLQGNNPTVAHRLSGSWYYEELSALNVSFSVGKEAENVGPPRGVLTSEVTLISLFGRHWFNDTWAGTYELLFVRQADIYSRRGIHIGIRYRI